MDQIILRIDKTSQRGRVAYLTINNEKRLNALSTPLMMELIEKLKTLGEDPDLRVAVLTGAGDKSFIGGADFHELKDLKPRSAREFLTLIHRVSKAIRDLPVPMIARINGYCLGAGTEVAAACDMRISVDAAEFGMPEVKVGLPSVVEAALLPRLIGWGKTRLLCYTGENITARQALEWGLVEKIVPMDRLDEGVLIWVTAILEAGPRAIRLQKELTGYWEKLSVTDAIHEGIKSIGKAYETDEPFTMLSAHIDRLKNRKK